MLLVNIFILTPGLYEINDIIQEARQEHEQKYRGEKPEEVEIKFNFKFLDKVINKTKKITTKNNKKTIVASQNRYESI